MAAIDNGVVARVYQAISASIEDRDQLETHASLPIRRSIRRAWESEAGRRLTPDELDLIRELFLAEYLRAIGRA
jgi:hypothetical protein